MQNGPREEHSSGDESRLHLPPRPVQPAATDEHTVELSSVQGPAVQRPASAPHVERTAAAENRRDTGSGSIVPADALRQVTSLEDLGRLYLDREREFKTTEELIDLVRQDWQIHARRWQRDSLQEKETFKPLIERITVDGKDCVLMGVVHSHVMGFEYIKELMDVVTKNPFWLSEHKLTAEFLPIPILEIPDHAADGFLPRLLRFQKRTFITMPLRALQSRIRMGRARPGEGSVSHQDLVRSLANMPPEALSDLPANIDILWREKSGLPLNECQRRSAFQAAFLRTWNPQGWPEAQALREQAPEAIKARWNEKAIMVGAGHVPEIAYFLKHGIPDKRIERLAVKQAELLNESVEKYVRFLARQESLFQVASYAASMAIGAGGTLAISQLANAALRLLQ